MIDMETKPITAEKKIMNQKYASSLNFLFKTLSSIGLEKNSTKYRENPRAKPKSPFLTKNNVSGIICITITQEGEK